MKKFLAITVIALGISACDPVTIPSPFPSAQNPITVRNLYEANLAYDGALKAFNKMKSLCAQRIIPNTCRTYVIEGQRLIPQIEYTRKTAQDFIKRNPTLNAGSLVDAYTTLVISLQNKAAQK